MFDCYRLYYELIMIKLKITFKSTIMMFLSYLMKYKGHRGPSVYPIKSSSVLYLFGFLFYNLYLIFTDCIVTLSY